MMSTKILDENKIKNIDKIKLEFKDKEKLVEMKDRKYFTNKTLGYTWIQILYENDIGYLNVNDIIFEKPIESFNNQTVYILQLSKNKNVTFSSGKILFSKKNQIIHDCALTEEFLGLPIISKNSSYFKALGIKTSYDENNKCYIAIPILDIIMDIRHQICPIILDDEMYKKKIEKEIFNLMKLFPKNENNSFSP